MAERLRGHGLAVDVKPVKEARDLDGYDAVVLGAPFYLGSMLKEARTFLERQRAALEEQARSPLRPRADERRRRP